MNDQQINTAIAEACGWERGNSSLQQEWLRPSRKEHRTCVSSWVTVEGLPDYCNDLNAMHEAWLSLSDKDKFACDKELMRVLVASKDGPYWMTNSTAKQRAEAFLKAIGKWKD